MSKMLLAVGFLIGVNIVSGCDKNIQCIEKHIFDGSGAAARYFEYYNKSDTMICRNMIPEDFKKCRNYLDSASRLEFKNCDFSKGIRCTYAEELTFLKCAQIKTRNDVHAFVDLWYFYHEAIIVIDNETV